MHNGVMARHKHTNWCICIWYVCPVHCKVPVGCKVQMNCQDTALSETVTNTYIHPVLHCKPFTKTSLVLNCAISDDIKLKLSCATVHCCLSDVPECYTSSTG